MKRLLLIISLATACGGEVPQTEACAAWVSCVQARDAELGVQTDVERFTVNGACWGGSEGAALCDDACDNGLAWMAEAYDDLPGECL